MSTTTAFAMLTNLISSFAGLFQDFLDLVITNWLPLVIVLSIIGVVIGIFMGAIYGLFRGGRHR